MGISSKRLRSDDSDEADQGLSGSVAKKQRSLPLRTSPSSSPRSLFKRTPQTPGPHTVPITLTPAESSDEDVDRESSSTLSAFHISQPSSACSVLSTKANASSDDSMDTAEMPPPSVSGWKRPELTRMRSNDLSFSSRPIQLHFSTNSEQPGANGGRIPTPIYGHFASTDVNMDTSEASLNSFLHPAARLQLRHSHNILSPMISEDGESEADWWRRRQLPSPVGSPVTMQQMDTDDLTSPDMMDALSFDNVQTLDTEMVHPATPSPPLSCSSRTGSRNGHAMFQRPSDTRSEATRRGKLVMGFRADCDKCLKRVVGHYSHIVWE